MLFVVAGRICLRGILERARAAMLLGTFWSAVAPDDLSFLLAGFHSVLLLAS